jgi:hypothetical protein
MNSKNNKLITILLTITCLHFYSCKSQQQVDLDLQKNVTKFVIDAKNAGVLDDKLAKALVTYSILNNLSIEEVQKLVMMSELSGLSNQTRSIDLDTAAAISKKSSAGEALMWICSCSVAIVTICALILFVRNQTRERKMDGVKQDLKDAMDWAYSTGEDAIIKADKAIKETIKKLRKQQ